MLRLNKMKLKRKYQKKIKIDASDVFGKSDVFDDVVAIDESESLSKLSPDEVTEKIAMNAYNAGYSKGFTAGLETAIDNETEIKNKIEFADLLIEHLEFKNNVMKNNCNIDDLSIFAECKELQDIMK